MAQNWNWLAARQVGKTLGRFDPAAMALDFSSEFGIKVAETSGLSGPEALLVNVPSDVLAHELAHFSQTTATAFGARQFFLAQELMFANLRAIRHAGKFSKAAVTYPLIRMSENHEVSGDFVHALTWSTCIARIIWRHVGGFPISAEQFSGLDCVHAAGDSIIACKGIDLFSDLNEGRYLFFANLARLEHKPGRDAVLLGAVHLMEGYGRAVEILRRTQERSEAQSPPRDGGPRFDIKTRRIHPYWLAYHFYAGHAPDVEEGKITDLQLLELCVIIDVALMSDGWVWAKANDLSTTADGFYDHTPWERFLELLQALARERTNLPRLTEQWSMADIVVFQDALLAASYGADSLTMAQLSAALDRYTQLSFENLRNQPVFSAHLLSRYEDCFRRMMQLRTAHANGPILGILTDGPRSTLELIAGNAPTVFVGGKGIAQDDFAAGESSLGVLQVRSLAHSLVYGDGPCPQHEINPRPCDLPERGLCTSIARWRQRPEGARRCHREVVFQTIRNPIDTEPFPS